MKGFLGHFIHMGNCEKLIRGQRQGEHELMTKLGVRHPLVKAEMISESAWCGAASYLLMKHPM
jgi:hypothetical protein